MKNTIKRSIALVIAAVVAFTGVPSILASAAPVVIEEIPHDDYEVTEGIDSLETTSYSCLAGNNVEFARSGGNIVKLHLKEHDDTASTGNKIQAFSIFTDHPDWIRVVVCDDGVNVNYPDIVDDDNYPSARMHSGTSITVPNHHAEFDAWGNQTYEGGAIVFLVANDYAGSGEEDRTVSVTIISRQSPDTMLVEDCTNITVDIDAKDAEPEVVEEPEPEPEVVEEPKEDPVVEEPANDPPAEQPSDRNNNGNGNNNGNNGNHNGNGHNNGNTNNNGNHNGNINGNGNNSSSSSSGSSSSSSSGSSSSGGSSAPSNPQPVVEAVVPDPEPEEESEIETIVEEVDEFETEEDDSVYYEVGEEIETPNATYTVVSNEGNYEVEYTETDSTTKSVTIPKSVTIGGIKYAVTSIGDNAFAGNTKIKSVNIGSNVTEIGSKAFWGCKNLKTIKIASKNLKLANIGDGAFKKIASNAIIKVPKSKIKTYKKMFIKRGLSSKAKFKKL